MAKRAAPRPKKSELTREKILDTALEQFRKHGFAATTMRQIADGAGLAMGAAYYYFDSKDAILFAYYARNREQHEARARAAMAGAHDLRSRLGAVLHAGLEVIDKERPLLGALVGRLADPRDPISAFSVEQAGVRERSIALFDSAFAGEPIDDALRAIAAPAMWMLYMGLLLYFVRDDSKGQRQTHRLVDDTLGLVTPLLALAGSPFAAPLRAQLTETLVRAGLIDPLETPLEAHPKRP
jgi:AcrR family transcriptional regulator